MKVGFIGLGNVGGKLAGSLLRNGFDLTVRDLNQAAARPLLDKGAKWANSPKLLAEAVDMVITCLPSPAASSAVMEGEDGVLEGLGSGKIWLEMSTTDEAELRRLAEKVVARGAAALDAPVSGGCHRAATGNISIFVGGERGAFERALPALGAMGRRILHTGPLGSASVLKVITNYLCSVHLVALGEALTVAARSGMDLKTTYEAIRISSGNSFVHETESQVILNGSYNINFTMDLVVKDMSLFDGVAKRHGVPLELSPLVLDIFREGAERYGARAWSSMIVKRLEDACGIDLRAPGFPEELVDREPEAPGEEVLVSGPGKLDPAGA
ncbi:MAG: NAD(P)-dependent oxidoreductase [Gammaproteobacteria bacterium]|nr:NAD(P)-dependent oxidoreductase [Gammaproteobacteria bacterium]